MNAPRFVPPSSNILNLSWYASITNPPLRLPFGGLVSFTSPPSSPAAKVEIRTWPLRSPVVVSVPARVAVVFGRAALALLNAAIAIELDVFEASKAATALPVAVIVIVSFIASPTMLMPIPGTRDTISPGESATTNVPFASIVPNPLTAEVICAIKPAAFL
jgi:hypothetical protein